MKRKILVIATLVVSLGLLDNVTSYTQAKVDNPVSLTISSSENALIAYPSDLVLVVQKDIFVTNLLNDNNVIRTESEVVVSVNQTNFYIKNNMNQTVNINVYIDSEVTEGFIKIKNSSITLSPGQEAKILFEVKEEVKKEIVDILIDASWHDGSATIREQITVEVIEIIDTSEVVIKNKVDRTIEEKELDQKADEREADSINENKINPNDINKNGNKDGKDVEDNTENTDDKSHD